MIALHNSVLISFVQYSLKFGEELFLVNVISLVQSLVFATLKEVNVNVSQMLLGAIVITVQLERTGLDQTVVPLATAIVLDRYQIAVINKVANANAVIVE